MRRLLAVLAALVLVASLASSSVAAGPTSRVNRFVGNFDLVDFDMTTLIGHVVANVSEPSAQNLVPGTVDITWAPGREFRETHVLLTRVLFGESTWEDPFSPTGTFHAIEAYLYGARCDYVGPQVGTCQPFSMIFQQITDVGTLSANKVGFSMSGTDVCCDGDWFPAALDGAWVLTYAGPTFP